MRFDSTSLITLKGLRHKDFAVLGQFCAKVIIMLLLVHKMLLLNVNFKEDIK